MRCCAAINDGPASSAGGGAYDELGLAGEAGAAGGGAPVGRVFFVQMPDLAMCFRFPRHTK